MATSHAQLPALFNALGDPTRLAVVARLSQGPASVSELGAPHAMAPPSFLKHLKVLETAGLIHSRKAGRVRTVRLAPGAMRSVEDWVRAHRLAWERRLDDLGTFLEQDDTP
ncbi:MAG TPA: metalloregulator ArsR/SmtB family transcription factor [Caulobacteraceae bacterium]|jgi:DNA-binding transcriptional ArsR family regulator|nr:metalloregulator ArsR/SmtB family transcription factor [Caulobacteraceae bacterium]